MSVFNSYVLTAIDVRDSRSMQTVLVFGGKTGWIGQKLVVLLRQAGLSVYCAQSRMENREEVIREIETINPTHIINAAGITGVPNIDWCEDHKQETIRANVIGALTIADIAYNKGIHLTYLGTGCVYEYDADHPVGKKVGFKETDMPNFTGSFYSLSKGFVQRLLANYPNVLILRLRMPISSDFSPRNFIVKITKYKKVINVPNSVTILDDLLPVAIDMVQKKLTGVYNFVNPGAISHNEVLELYKRYVDSAFVYQNFSLEEQTKVLKAGRSNCELDASKLLSLYPGIPTANQSMIKVLQMMGIKKKRSNEELL